MGIRSFLFQGLSLGVFLFSTFHSHAKIHSAKIGSQPICYTATCDSSINGNISEKTPVDSSSEEIPQNQHSDHVHLCHCLGTLPVSNSVPNAISYGIIVYDHLEHNYLSQSFGYMFKPPRV